MTGAGHAATIDPGANGPPEAVGGDLGTRLRELRRSRGVSLAEVAEGTGISASFLSTVEKGKSELRRSCCGSEE